MPGISKNSKKELKEKNLVLLTGATGYVGGRLLKALEEIEELPKDRFEELSHRAHNYACSYLTPVTDQRMNIFLEV